MDQVLKIQNFYDLDAWKQGHDLVKMIYETSKSFPRDEIFGLTSQMRRAAVSITSNIAEGFSRRSLKDKIHFYTMACGSATELYNQIFVARDVKYLSEQDFKIIEMQIIRVHKIMNGSIAKLQSNF